MPPQLSVVYHTEDAKVVKFVKEDFSVESDDEEILKNSGKKKKGLISASSKSTAREYEANYKMQNMDNE